MDYDKMNLAALREECQRRNITPARSAEQTRARLRLDDDNNPHIERGTPTGRTPSEPEMQQLPGTSVAKMCDCDPAGDAAREHWHGEGKRECDCDTCENKACEKLAAMDFGPIEQRVVMHMGIDMASGPDRTVAQHPALFAPYGSIPPAMTQVRGTKAVQNDPAAKAAARRKMRKQMRKATRRAQRGG